jgi:hypothetical protein
LELIIQIRQSRKKANGGANRFCFLGLFFLQGILAQFIYGGEAEHGTEHSSSCQANGLQDCCAPKTTCHTPYSWVDRLVSFPPAKVRTKEGKWHKNNSKNIKMQQAKCAVVVWRAGRTIAPLLYAHLLTPTCPLLPPSPGGAVSRRAGAWSR